MSDLAQAGIPPPAPCLDLDLRQLGTIYDRAELSFRRLIIYLGFAIGVCTALAGILAVFFAPHSTWDGRLTLVLVGVMVAGYAGYSFGQLPRAAVRLRVDSMGVQLWTLKGVHVTLTWTDAKVRLKVFNLPNTLGRQRPAGLGACCTAPSRC